MLVENQIIEVKWNNRSKKHYESLGYKFTKTNDKFLVHAEDLTFGSHQLVKVQCDFCGKIITKKMHTYNVQHHPKYGDCCCQCQLKKNKLVCMDKYGVDNGSKTQAAIDKIKNTCMERYGVDNGSKTTESRRKISEKIIASYQDETVVQKRINTNRERYGCDSPTQNEQVRQKQKETMIQKYGVDYPKKSEEIRAKEREHNRQKYGYDYYWQTEEAKTQIKNTNLKKYGVECTLQLPEIREKGLQTMIRNRTYKTSKLQERLCELLIQMYGECEYNKPCGTKLLDCVITVGSQMIDVEYDGRYWHQDKERDKLRDEFCISQGYKVLRINSRYSLPSEECIYEAISQLIDEDLDSVCIMLDI